MITLAQQKNSKPAGYVITTNSRRYYFPSLSEATKAAADLFRRTGVVAGIELATSTRKGKA